MKSIAAIPLNPQETRLHNLATPSPGHRGFTLRGVTRFTCRDTAEAPVPTHWPYSSRIAGFRQRRDRRAWTR